MLEATEGKCFACGPANPIGLKLAFREEGEAYVAEFHPREEHQGYDGIVHGGLVATVLDEVMARWLWRRDLPFATAELTVRYLAPVPVGRVATARAVFEKQTPRLIEMSAVLTGEGGEVLARAKGRFLPMRGPASADA
jgi:acyl-coenzyme A thioesterase PaaI-like protein